MKVIDPYYPVLRFCLLFAKIQGGAAFCLCAHLLHITEWLHVKTWVFCAWFSFTLPKFCSSKECQWLIFHFLRIRGWWLWIKRIPRWFNILCLVVEGSIGWHPTCLCMLAVNVLRGVCRRTISNKLIWGLYWKLLGSRWRCSLIVGQLVAYCW